MRTDLGIQTKITIFIIIVVISILSVSTYVSRRLTEEKAEEHLRERYINIVKQIDASIVTLRELRDTQTLEEELTKLLHVRPNIVSVEIFDLSGKIVRLTARAVSNEDELFIPPDTATIEAIKNGEVRSTLETGGGDRFWKILVPIQIKKEISGLIRARISTKEFDTLVAHDRRQAFLLTLTTSLTLLVFLVWYLRRKIGRPIRTLVRAMAQAEAGNLESRVAVRSRDELGMLSEQFNQMLLKIRESSEKIRNFNEELQAKVEQATAELNRRNEELMNVNRRLYQTQLQLAHFERLAAAGQVAATVAHRVGTPLHSILGHLHRLPRDTSPARREERLGIIESQVERVIQIIQELLDTVRKPEPRMEPVLINKLLEDLLNLVMPGLSLRGIKVRSQLDPRVESVTGDSGQLQEVFLNILTNAMDAMPNGGDLEIITIFNGGSAGPLRKITVTVRDTGCGIAEGDLARIFDPFFTTKERAKGTGLGLSICQEIIKAHGGEIQVSSLVGMGATFTVKLPAGTDETA